MFDVEPDKVRQSELAINRGKTIVGRRQVLKSAAGFYIGRLCYEGGCPQPYCRDSGYYTDEESAKAELNDYL